MSLLKKIAVILVQLAVVVYLSLLAQKGLEVIPVPDVFKNMSLIELEDLDRSILQSAVDLKSKFISNEAAVDSNIIIVNVESINPVPRAEIAKAIRFLKDNGAKTIALNVFIDESRDDIDPLWDTELASALEYKEKNVIGINGFQYFSNEKGELDTMLALNPIDKFHDLRTVGFGNLEMTPENEGSIVQQFYPNIIFKGRMISSFPLAVASHFDSLRAKTLKNKTDKEYVNFYRKELFKVWNMSFLTNPLISEAFAPFVKNKLFMIGYINPEADALKFNMYSTPIGKLEYSIVYAGIISDILTHKFVPESPFTIDMMVGALFCLFNIILYAQAMRRTVKWEKLTGVILIPLEIVIIYTIVIFVFVFFNYKLSVIIPSIVIMISVPFNRYANRKIVPLFSKLRAGIKYSHIPYPFLQQYLNIFDHEKRSARRMTTLFGFQRFFWLLSAIADSAASKFSGSTPEFRVITNWNSLSAFSKENAGESVNKTVSFIIEKLGKIMSELNKVTDEYYKLFTHNNLKREIYVRLEEERDIDPGKDRFGVHRELFHDMIKGLDNEFGGYRLIYISKKDTGKYLVRDLSDKRSAPEYLVTEESLIPGSVYMYKKGTAEFISMEPKMFYIQCKYHDKKELFVFSNIQFDEYSGQERAHYVGEYFMCSPLVPPGERMKQERK